MASDGAQERFEDAPAYEGAAAEHVALEIATQGGQVRSPPAASCGYARRRAPAVEKSGVPCFGLSDRAPTPRLFWCTTKHAPPRQLRGLAESEIPLGNARLSCFVFGDTNSEGAPFVPPPTTTASGACRGA